jgi:hypothetical protein
MRKQGRLHRPSPTTNLVGVVEERSAQTVRACPPNRLRERLLMSRSS